MIGLNSGLEVGVDVAVAGMPSCELDVACLDVTAARA